MLPMDSEGRPQKACSFVQTPYAEGGQTFSPDGRFVAYVSSETGRNEVYVCVRSLKLEGGGRFQLTAATRLCDPGRGASCGNAILAVDVTTTPTFAARNHGACSRTSMRQARLSGRITTSRLTGGDS